MNKDFHALIVKGSWLVQVQDVEFNGVSWLSVGHLEVKPLGVAPSVDVVLKDEVIFSVRNFNG